MAEPRASDVVLFGCKRCGIIRWVEYLPEEWAKQPFQSTFITECPFCRERTAHKVLFHGNKIQ